MTDEERQRAMDFIVETLGRLSVNEETHDARLARLIESHEKAEHRLDRDERILKLMTRAGRRADLRLTKALVELTEKQKRTADSIAHTDSKLHALVDIVRADRNGSRKNPLT